MAFFVCRFVKYFSYIIIIINIIIIVIIIIIQYISEDDHSNSCIVMYKRYKHVGCHSEPV